MTGVQTCALPIYKEECAVYENIMKEYPLYGQAHNVDVEKLLDRARLQAGN